MALEGLKPQDVFMYFEQMSAIPHGSYNTANLADYLVAFAGEKGLESTRDEAGNVMIRKPASPGCEDKEPLILQGHIDMVCEKSSDNPIDMEKEAIRLLVDGDYIHADRTTLGADDGMGCAMILAVLADDELKHPALECIFTNDEEVGMLGAEALDMSSLKGRRLLNLDGEGEGLFMTACAGGAHVRMTVPGDKKTMSGPRMKVSVEGLLGGHSGEAIRYGRANAVLVLGRILYGLYKVNRFNIVSLNGGSKDNAIPREASCELVFRTKENKEFDENRIYEYMDGVIGDIFHEYQLTDPGIKISYEEKSAAENLFEEEVYSKSAVKSILRILELAPYGVQEYSPSMENMPQTSLNAGILASTEDGFELVFLVRSSIDSQRDMVVEKLRALAELNEAEFEIAGVYPAWEFKPVSPFRDLLAGAYEKAAGSRPVMAQTHGGLECGMFCGKIPTIECVSAGPALYDIHTPAEKVSVSSVERFYDFLRKAVTDCAEN